ncbi:glycosyltransferase [bacterium]|nr:glycosyltransferase [bacterium]
MGMGVSVIAYNRPHYMAKVVRSIESNPESQTLPFHFFLDGGSGATQEENLATIRQSTIRDVHVVAREGNLGCQANTIESRREMFDELGYETVLLVEDDLVLSSHCIGLVTRLLAWATDSFDNVGAVQAWDTCLMSREEKARCLSHVRPRSMGSHWQGYALTRRAWQAMRPVLIEYEEQFVGNSHSGMDHAAIRSFIRERASQAPRRIEGETVPDEPDARDGFFQPNVATGQDAIHALAMWQAGLVRLCGVVNRSLQIGRVGLHGTDEQFVAMGMDRVQLDVFEEDRTLSAFELIA